MNTIVLGNLVSLLGCTLMVAIGFIRKKESILKVQCLQFGLLGTANLILGGITGFISAIISIIRNVVFAKWSSTVLMKAAFVIPQVLISALANASGFIGWLPILSTALFTWLIDTKDPVAFKLVLILTQLLWVVYDLWFLNYVAFTFDIFTILANIISIMTILKARRNP